MPPADVETSGCGAEGVYHSVAGSSQKRKRSPYFLPVLSVTLVILVLVWGALVFMHLEQPRERAQAAEFLALKAELENSLLNMTETEQEVLRRYLAFTERYLYTRATAPEDDRVSWSFMGAVYFCVTVVTTIGYGTYTPETEAGKGFLLFYALVGIPAFIVMLTIMSETLLSPINMLIKQTVVLLVKQRWLRSTSSVSVSSVAIVLLATFTTLFVLLWSCAFAAYNEWPYLDAVYFALVTVTTIGFGDFSPDTNALVWVEHCMYIFYFIFGLISMGTLIAAIQNKVVHHQERVRQKHAKKAPCSSSYPAAEMTVVSHSPAVSDNTKTATGTPRQLEDDFSSQYDSDVGHGSGRGRGGLMVGKGPKSDERGA
mmetsp:Transcript_8712/g.21026  ORF Transcript_8712/g.21026 Transcript_8712/m.21026 type:complete len:371 (+) Transcript_8712:259-1371(+)